MLSWADVRGVGPVRSKELERAGFPTPESLVECLPSGYRDTTDTTPIANLRPGMEACFAGRVLPQARVVRASGRVYVTATIEDQSGRTRCVWFSAPWMLKNLPTGRALTLFGRVTRMRNGATLVVNPSIVEERGIQPVYRPIDKLPPKTRRALILAALEAGRFDDALPETFRNRHDLCPRQLALWQAHFPRDHQALSSARRRLAFEELTLFQTYLQGLRAHAERGAVIPSAEKDMDAFWDSLPFSPTDAQKRALSDIREDLAADAPMARLIQGDVGSGKTAIAFGALFFAAEAGFQGALMAPTEALAAQHYRTALRLLEPLGVPCALLTGKQNAAARRDARERVASGMARVVIGTHALLSEGVAYQNLGLVITDEQHRFGVRQRTRLAEKAEIAPNVLVLSATPIPRSLSLVLYGDLDVSIVDELPPGRVPVVTKIVPEAKREGMYGFVRAEAAAGRQAYIICPLVEEDAQFERASAEEMFESLLNGALAGLRLGLAHGKMQPQALSETLLDFSEGRLDVLVATTVVEVGMDVPGASVMIVENADSFGLSQLHQLRGRVGRGKQRSYCFLMGEPNARLDALMSTNDGFVIAQIDLEQRGPGEWFGTRQHGAPELPGAMLGGDVALLGETQHAVKSLLSDPARAFEAQSLRDAANARFGGDAIGIN